MDYVCIVKPGVDTMSTKPNLDNWQAMREDFSWESVADELDWFEGGALNIAHEVLDRHISTPRRDAVALFWEGKDGRSETYTFQDLSKLTNRFANALTSLGVKKGDRVFTYLDRTPESFIALLGALKTGAIIGPLFSAFGPDAVKDRLQDSGATVLVTNPRLVKTVHEILPELPDLEQIIMINRDGSPYDLREREVDYEELMAAASDEFEVARMDKDDFAIMHYTSGTTGKPKGAAHVHQAILGHYATAKYVLDLRLDDVYWCTADSGWVTGTSYGIFGPWSNGISQVVYEGGFGAML